MSDKSRIVEQVDNCRKEDVNEIVSDSQRDARHERDQNTDDQSTLIC